jgi:hypothetical protein
LFYFTEKTKKCTLEKEALIRIVFEISASFSSVYGAASDRGNPRLPCTFLYITKKVLSYQRQGQPEVALYVSY